jgi:class 3 adenylate cyclase/tetratricopeptide (TPR) repeat protein
MPHAVRQDKPGKRTAGGLPETYIPGDRRRALAAGREMPDRVWGSALFLDISGFTPLTETLARELGPQRGAEELSTVLNSVFGAVLGVLNRYGGSVLYFSGDAVTCWLEGDGHLAIACGLEMQEAMSSVSTVRSPGGTTVEIAMKVSIAVGPARRFVVGDPDVQLIDVLAGSLMDRLAATEQRAERGQVVIDGPTLDGIGGLIEVAVVHGEGSGRAAVVAAVAPLSTPLPPPPPYPRLPRSISRRWLLPSVYERMRAGSGEFLTELRPAVPMFIRFGGIDYDHDDEAERLLDEFIRRVQWVVDGQGGNVLSLTIGDKGAYLYAVFGSPTAHEDDAARACAAALDVLAIEGETAATGIQVGIASGLLWSGPFGHVQRKTFNCFGDATNLAARLMSAAPAGQAYATAEVARASGGRFVFEEQPAFKPKGKSTLIPIRRLTGVDRRAPIRDRRTQHELVGRIEEMALLRDLSGQALAGRGRVIALAGEAGMGKSRLADEILGSIRADGVPVYSGAAASVGGGSYQAWQGVWTSLLDVEHEDDPARDLERSLAATDPDLLPRLPLLGSVLGVAIEDNELTASFDAKLRKTSLESLLIRYLTCRAGRAPMVLFLDDCHWIDALSKDLLDLVARAVQSLPVLVLLTHRPGAFAAPRLAHTAVVELDRLDDDSCKRLLTDRLAELYGPDHPPSEALMEHLVRRAEGNPFFLEELANYLHSEGADPSETDATALNLPSTLSSLVLSRIDTLGESSRQTLKVASVVGREFALAALTGSYPKLGDRRRVSGHLRRLTSADLVIYEDPATDFYAFKHAVIREVAYESLPFAFRAVLHGRVGNWIETTEPESLDLLAYHYWMSGDEPKKREYLRKAGEAAEARYANEAAIDYYRRLVGLLGDDERGSILLRLGKILELAGELEEAERLSVEAIVLAERTGDDVAAAWARTSRAEPMRKQGRYDEAEAELATAWTTFEKEGESSGCGRVAHIRGLIANLQGDSERSRTQFEQALEMSRDRGDRRTEATLLSNLAMPVAMEGNYELAQDLSEQALVIRNELGDRWGIGVSLNNIGMLAYLRQDYEGARAPLEEAVAAGEQAGDSYGVAVARHNLGNASRQLGEAASAGGHYAEALRIYSLLGDRWSLTMLFDDIAIHLAAGSPREAFRLAGASDALRESVGSPRPDYQEAEFQEAMAGARAELGDSAAEDEEAGRRLDVDAATALAITLCGAMTSHRP